MFVTANYRGPKLMPRDDETPLEYWLSFWPTAPLFGVAWRFGDVTFAGFEGLAKSQKPRKAAAKPASRIDLAAPDAEVLPQTSPAPARVAPKAAKPAPTPAKPAPEPAAVKSEPATVEPAPAKPARPDELTVIKGIGPKMAEKLAEQGVTTYAQIAAWNAAEVARMGEVLGGIPGAIERADWVGQAKELA